MNMIERLNAEIREILAKKTLDEGDIRRLGMLEQQLNSAMIRFDI